MRLNSLKGGWTSKKRRPILASRKKHNSIKENISIIVWRILIMCVFYNNFRSVRTKATDSIKTIKGIEIEGHLLYQCLGCIIFIYLLHLYTTKHIFTIFHRFKWETHKTMVLEWFTYSFCTLLLFSYCFITISFFCELIISFIIIRFQHYLLSCMSE